MKKMFFVMITAVIMTLGLSLPTLADEPDETEYVEVEQLPEYPEEDIPEDPENFSVWYMIIVHHTKNGDEVEMFKQLYFEKEDDWDPTDPNAEIFLEDF